MRPLEKMIEEFIDACLNRDDAQERGDAKTGNKQFRIIQKIRRELKSDSGYGVECLLPLLEHSNDYVRLEVAYSVIPIAPDKARQTFIELTKKRGLNAYTAEKTLEQWDIGKLNFDL